ncbi:MAG: hypothetical protein NTY04_01385 [Candidatus Staskawiczbacteria bacterium]|nr:hypothetical protein [Candidatus Staskawiczbacteria bacterium]
MPTQAEETQAKEFLKRAEVRTMKKDLLKLREADSLKERDKIAKIKTLEEQTEERKKIEAPIIAAREEKFRMEEVLQKNEGEERIAEKDLKNYGTEEERQQIFLLESSRLAFEKQIDEIDKKKDPELKLQKNSLLIQKRDCQTKLNVILDQEKKLEQEGKFITEKEQTTTIASQRKSLQESRWDLDKKIQEVEKKRWEAEKQIEDIDKKVSQIDISSEQLVAEKNGLKDKALGIDKSLREIYSVIMAREEDKRRGQAQEQVARRESMAKIRAQENEKVQRQQWSGSSMQKQTTGPDILSKAPQSLKEKLTKSFAAEEDQRIKFMRDVEGSSDLAVPRPRANVQATMPAPPLPPVPMRKK